MKRIRADVDELRAIVSGSSKPTNHARQLIEMLLHDTAPKSWKPYALASDVALTAWATDLAFRIETIAQLVNERSPERINLGARFNPGAFVTATRQHAARTASKSLEELHLVSSIGDVRIGSGLIFEGLTLIGAVVDGKQNLELKDAMPQQINMCVHWETNAAATPSMTALPLYLNEQRTDLIAMCRLAVVGDPSKFTLQGACLSAWRRR